MFFPDWSSRLRIQSHGCSPSACRHMLEGLAAPHTIATFLSSVPALPELGPGYWPGGQEGKWSQGKGFKQMDRTELNKRGLEHFFFFFQAQRVKENLGIQDFWNNQPRFPLAMSQDSIPLNISLSLALKTWQTWELSLFYSSATFNLILSFLEIRVSLYIIGD